MSHMWSRDGYMVSLIFYLWKCSCWLFYADGKKNTFTIAICDDQIIISKSIYFKYHQHNCCFDQQKKNYKNINCVYCISNHYLQWHTVFCVISGPKWVFDKHLTIASALLFSLPMFQPLISTCCWLLWLYELSAWVDWILNLTVVLFISKMHCLSRRRISQCWPLFVVSSRARCDVYGCGRVPCCAQSGPTNCSVTAPLICAASSQRGGVQVSRSWETWSAEAPLYRMLLEVNVSIGLDCGFYTGFHYSRLRR